MSEQILVQRELLERVVKDSCISVAQLDQLRQLMEQPASAPKPVCQDCSGTGVVDDGELTHSACGILFEMGPIKCVKDCPNCTRPAPAGVVLPERKSAVEVFTTYGLGECSGWNAYRDEYIRLNGAPK